MTKIKTTVGEVVPKAIKLLNYIEGSRERERQRRIEKLTKRRWFPRSYEDAEYIVGPVLWDWNAAHLCEQVLKATEGMSESALMLVDVDDMATLQRANHVTCLPESL